MTFVLCATDSSWAKNMCDTYKCAWKNHVWGVHINSDNIFTILQERISLLRTCRFSIRQLPVSARLWWPPLGLTSKPPLISQLFDVRCNSCGNPRAAATSVFHLVCEHSSTLFVHTHDNRSSWRRVSFLWPSSIIFFSEVHVNNTVRLLPILFHSFWFSRIWDATDVLPPRQEHLTSCSITLTNHSPSLSQPVRGERKAEN